MTDLLAELSAASATTLFVGDSVHDFAAGRGAGVRTVGLRCGYHAGGDVEPDLWLADPAALLALWRAARG